MNAHSVTHSRFGHGAFLLLLFLLLCSNPLSAAQIYVVWTSEAGVFAPLWVTKEAGVSTVVGRIQTGHSLFQQHGRRSKILPR